MNKSTPAFLVPTAIGLFLVSFCAALAGQSARGGFQPFVIDQRAVISPMVDLSWLNDTPAGRDGFVRIKDEHLVTSDGKRIRFWGVNLTHSGIGSTALPPMEAIPLWAGVLARFGVNLVRLPVLDVTAPKGITATNRQDSRLLDADQIDRLDLLIDELKKYGIYVDLVLNSRRTYASSDGVRDSEIIGSGLGLTTANPKLIELQKDYARQLLTHVNPYTRTRYVDEPAIALIEINNENNFDIGFQSPSNFYEKELQTMYNTWLRTHLAREDLEKVRNDAGVSVEQEVPRLKRSEVESAPTSRFTAEMKFVMDTQTTYFDTMIKYLRESLGVKALLIGSSDSNHSVSGYPMLVSVLRSDVIAGSAFWTPPASRELNRAMVDSPLQSTPVQLSRAAIAGKPFIVTETNDTFPSPFESENIPIMAAYGSFQDWDGIIVYSFEPRLAPYVAPYIANPFDISTDPVRLPELASGSLIFRRIDVRPGYQTIVRTYSSDEVLESRHRPSSEQPFFTPGFPLRLPLEHQVRINSSHQRGTTTSVLPPLLDAIRSDTKELAWYAGEKEKGSVTIETDSTQGLVGFIGRNERALKNLSVRITNRFAAIILTSLNLEPLARSNLMLLTVGSAAANTGMKLDSDGAAFLDPGGAPTLIEPVTGNVLLRHLRPAEAVFITAINGAGQRIGEPRRAGRHADEWSLPIGHTVTTWYLIEVKRRADLN